MKKKISDKLYDADFIYKIAEKYSYLIFGPIFSRLPFSSNQVTLLNFLTNNLAAVYFFTLGTHAGYLLGIFFCLTSAIFDWMDGFVARVKVTKSKAGYWLDPALDYVWQHSLAAALVIGVYLSKNQNIVWLYIGMFMLASLIAANYIGTTYKDKFDFRFRSSLTVFKKKIINSKNSTIIDTLFLEIQAPTNFLTLSFFTIRYPLIIGAIFNRMDIIILLMLISSIIKALVLFYVHYLYLDRHLFSKPLLIVKALEEREIKIIHTN
jgi:phosphatidylglycerophosphate synthase